MSEMHVPEGQTSDEVYDKEYGTPGPTPGETVDLSEAQNKAPPSINETPVKITHQG
jgi:hypothetical protein